MMVMLLAMLAFIVLWGMEEKPIKGCNPDIAQMVEAAIPEVLENADFPERPKG